MDVFVRGGQLHPIHEHPDWHELALVGAPVHHLVLHEVFGFRLGGGACPECLLPDQVDFHELYLKLDQVEQYFAENHILQMIEVLIKLELNVQAVLNSNLHFHLRDLLGLLHVAIVVQNCEVNFLDHGQLHVAGDRDAHEISNSPCDPVECLVLFLEIRELEFEALGFGQDAGGF